MPTMADKRFRPVNVPNYVTTLREGIAIIVLVIMLRAGSKRVNEKYQIKRQPQVVDMGMIQKLTKPYLLT